MGEDGWTKVWYGTALFALYLCLNFWSYSQQWGIEFPLALKFAAKINSYAAALLGVFFGGLAFGAFLLAARSFARLHGSRSKYNRVPFPASLQLNSAQSMKVYFWVVMTLFVAIPLGANIHFVTKIFRGTAMCGSESLTGWQLFDPSKMALAPCQYGGHEHPVSFYPFIEPVIVVVLAGLVGLLLVATILAVFRTAPVARTTASDDVATR